MRIVRCHEFNDSHYISSCSSYHLTIMLLNITQDLRGCYLVISKFTSPPPPPSLPSLPPLPSLPHHRCNLSGQGSDTHVIISCLPSVVHLGDLFSPALFRSYLNDLVVSVRALYCYLSVLCKLM